MSMEKSITNPADWPKTKRKYTQASQLPFDNPYRGPLDAYIPEPSRAEKAKQLRLLEKTGVINDETSLRYWKSKLGLEK